MVSLAMRQLHGDVLIELESCWSEEEVKEGKVMSVSFSETSSRQEGACRKMVARDLFKERGKGKRKVLDDGPFRGKEPGGGVKQG